MLPPTPETYAHWCRLSEEAGFDVVWVPDSQSLYRELYVSCAICAANTSNVLLGPNVTNPLTRHPATAASAIATVDEFSGGRALFGIATGDSAVLNLGLRPGRVDDMRDYVLAMRGMLEEGTAHYRGKPCALNWRKKRIPHLHRRRGAAHHPPGRRNRGRRHHRMRPHAGSRGGFPHLARGGRQEIGPQGGRSGRLVAREGERARRRRTSA